MKMIETDTEYLSVAQEFAILVSKVSQKEMNFFIEDDIEFLHEFRVELRKLRTWSQIFELANYPIKKLKKHLTKCHLIGGELRNFDVLIHWIENNNTLVSSACNKKIGKKRKKLRKIFMKELIKTKAISKLRNLACAFLPYIADISKADFEPYVKHYIEEKQQSIYAILPSAVEDLDQLHEVRKMLKKIRYALLLLPTFDSHCLKNLKELQDILGYINDRRVWIEIIELEFINIECANLLRAIFEEELNNKLIDFKDYVASKKVTSLFSKSSPQAYQQADSTHQP